MLCEQCNQREAVYTITVIHEGGSTNRSLCKECLAETRATMGAKLIGGMAAALMAAAGLRPGAAQNQQQAQEKEESQPDLPRCEACGRQLDAREPTLGCSACCDAFRPALTPVLMRIHGRSGHIGRRPLVYAALAEKRNRITEMKRSLERAVQQEDYETAARVRDELARLQGKEAQG